MTTSKKATATETTIPTCYVCATVRKHATMNPKGRCLVGPCIPLPETEGSYFAVDSGLVIDGVPSPLVFPSLDVAVQSLIKWDGVALGLDGAVLGGSLPEGKAPKGKATPKGKASTQPAPDVNPSKGFDATPVPQPVTSATPATATVQGKATRKGAVKRASKATPKVDAPKGDAPKIKLTPAQREAAEKRMNALISQA